MVNAECWFVGRGSDGFQLSGGSGGAFLFRGQNGGVWRACSRSASGFLALLCGEAIGRGCLKCPLWGELCPLWAPYCPLWGALCPLCAAARGGWSDGKLAQHGILLCVKRGSQTTIHPSTGAGTIPSTTGSECGKFGSPNLGGLMCAPERTIEVVRHVSRLGGASDGRPAESALGIGVS